MRKFGMIDKLAYLAGDLANDFTFMMVSFYLTLFYTNVLGIDGKIVGLLFLSSRVLDAFTDVGMGVIVDSRKVTEEGKFRYWILRAAPFVTIAGFLLFAHWVKDFSYSAKLVYIFATYIFWGSICYTAINIPYGSMASVITDKPEERAALSSFRSMGASIAQVIITFIGPKVLYYKDASGNPIIIPERFTVLAGVLCVAAFLLYLFCYFNTVERIKAVPTEKKNNITFSKIMSSLATNKPLQAFIAIAICLLLTSLLVSGLNIYLYTVYFKSIGGAQLGGMLGTVGTFILVPFVPIITKKLGKQVSGAIGVIWSSVFYLVLFLVKIKDVNTFLVIIVLANLGYTYFNVIIWSFIMDIIDAQEVKTNTREDGVIYAIYSFSRKIGQALAGGLTGYVLSAIGFISGVQIQSEAVANNIYKVYTLSGFIGYLIVAVILYFIFPLSKEKVEENTRILNERKGK